MKKRANLTNLAFLIIFGSAFGFVEAAVVYYLRILISFNPDNIIGSYKTVLNLGFVDFVIPVHTLLINQKTSAIEVIREFATIIMLISIAYVAGRNLRHRVGAFLVAFACWDIMYYVFLKIFDNWPSSLMTKDILFLIPVAWIGPVITPLVISLIMLIGGSKLYLSNKK